MDSVTFAFLIALKQCLFVVKVQTHEWRSQQEKNKKQNKWIPFGHVCVLRGSQIVVRTCLQLIEYFYVPAMFWRHPGVSKVRVHNQTELLVSESNGKNRNRQLKEKYCFTLWGILTGLIHKINFFGPNFAASCVTLIWRMSSNYTFCRQHTVFDGTVSPHPRMCRKRGPMTEDLLV